MAAAGARTATLLAGSAAGPTPKAAAEPTLAAKTRDELRIARYVGSKKVPRAADLPRPVA